MADTQQNVRRLQELDRATLEATLKTKMLGQTNDSNPSLGFKKSSGEMEWYNSEGSDAIFRSITDEELAGTGNRNVGVDENGKLIQLAVGELEYLDFQPQDIAPPYNEGRLFYNADENSMEVFTDNPNYPNIMGESEFARGKNESGETIPIGTAVYFMDIESGGGGLNIYLASADTYNKNWAVGFTTEEILDGEWGTCSFFGTHYNVDTSGLTPGKPAYLSTTPGQLTSNRPQFPADAILIGSPIFIDSVNGVFVSKITHDSYDVSFDGCIIERQDYNIVVEGTQVFLDLFNDADPTRNLPIQLSSSTIELDTTTGTGVGGAARVELLQGTPQNALGQIIYIDETGGVAELKTTAGYPAVPFATVAELAIQDYANVTANKPIVDRQITSDKSHDGRGRISYLTERWGISSPSWYSGVTPTATIDTVPTPDLLDLSVLAGIVYQTHRHTFPALSVDTDGVYVLNASGTGSLTTFQKLNNLILANEDINGNVYTNNRMHLTIVGVINKLTSECKLAVNLPNSVYSTNDSQAYYDYNSTAVNSVPADLRFTSFLIARIPIRISSGGDSVEFINPSGLDEIINLLGTPIGVAGGGSGGGGAFIPNLTQVLAEGSDAGNIQINNMADGTLAQDAVTLSQLQSQIPTITGNNGDIVIIDTNTPVSSTMFNANTTSEIISMKADSVTLDNVGGTNNGTLTLYNEFNINGNNSPAVVSTGSFNGQSLHLVADASINHYANYGGGNTQTEQLHRWSYTPSIGSQVNDSMVLVGEGYAFSSQADNVLIMQYTTPDDIDTAPDTVVPTKEWVQAQTTISAFSFVTTQAELETAMEDALIDTIFIDSDTAFTFPAITGSMSGAKKAIYGNGSIELAGLIGDIGSVLNVYCDLSINTANPAVQSVQIYCRNFSVDIASANIFPVLSGALFYENLTTANTLTGAATQEYWDNTNDLKSVGVDGQLNTSDGDGGWSDTKMNYHGLAAGTSALDFDLDSALIRNTTGILTLSGIATGSTSGTQVSNNPIGNIDIANKAYVDSVDLKAVLDVDDDANQLNISNLKQLALTGETEAVYNSPTTIVAVDDTVSMFATYTGETPGSTWNKHKTEVKADGSIWYDVELDAANTTDDLTTTKKMEISQSDITFFEDVYMFAGKDIRGLQDPVFGDEPVTKSYGDTNYLGGSSKANLTLVWGGDTVLTTNSIITPTAGAGNWSTNTMGVPIPSSGGWSIVAIQGLINRFQTNNTTSSIDVQLRYIAADGTSNIASGNSGTLLHTFTIDIDVNTTGSTKYYFRASEDIDVSLPTGEYMLIAVVSAQSVQSANGILLELLIQED